MNKRFALKNSHFWIQFGFAVVAVGLGGLQAWNSRFDLFSGDTIAYLDIGKAYLSGDWQTAVNGYFSPLYGLIIASVLAIMQPSDYWIFLAVKAANVLIFCFCLLNFSLFLHQLIRFHRDQRRRHPEQLLIPNWIWLTLGYTLFLWSTLVLIGVATDTPDMLVASWVYLAMALILKIQVRPSWGAFIGLGAVMGFGYLSKAILFPMALIFWGMGLFAAWPSRQIIPKAITALLVFGLIATPLVTAISLKQGELSFGEAGSLNYAWNISGIPSAYWLGGDGTGTPQNPLTLLSESPAVYEFSDPFPNTFGRGYDPSYWYAGLIAQPNLSRQIATVWEHIIEYYRIFAGFLLFVYLLLLVASGRIKASLMALAANWLLLLPAAAGLGSLMLIHVRSRMIASFVILLALGLFNSLTFPNTAVQKRLLSGFAVGSILLLLTQLSWPAPGTPTHWKIAQGMQVLGLESGDKIAILGAYRAGDHYFWAYLANLRIAAEIPSPVEFWTAEPERRSQIYRDLQAAGIKALVQRPPNLVPDFTPLGGWQAIGEAFMQQQGWQEIGKTHCYVYPLE
ncbi:hypothetical protein IQ241_03945 [Romeria aff. gracilis LEGE 07310]|uniref:Uncharacterized protein n=1 Tax=Vasconcelosia minhoensis LEGE 07310 TaxID=915328 RepID=A0A8J7AB99_9CYAN|nr:hypothetical protein [Romeria gracilis]MBE9076454.1 hypothetical protein [Romeria aff. gracilis LEGE 07310]